MVSSHGNIPLIHLYFPEENYWVHTFIDRKYSHHKFFSVTFHSVHVHCRKLPFQFLFFHSCIILFVMTILRIKLGGGGRSTISLFCGLKTTSDETVFTVSLLFFFQTYWSHRSWACSVILAHSNFFVSNLRSLAECTIHSYFLATIFYTYYPLLLFFFCPENYYTMYNRHYFCIYLVITLQG